MKYVNFLGYRKRTSTIVNKLRYPIVRGLQSVRYSYKHTHFTFTKGITFCHTISLLFKVGSILEIILQYIRRYQPKEDISLRVYCRYWYIHLYTKI